MEDGTTKGYEGAVGGGVLVKEVCGCARVVRIVHMEDWEKGRCYMFMRGGVGGAMAGGLGWDDGTALLLVVSSSGERHGIINYWR